MGRRTIGEKLAFQREKFKHPMKRLVLNSSIMMTNVERPAQSKHVFQHACLLEITADLFGVPITVDLFKKKLSHEASCALLRLQSAKYDVDTEIQP